MKLVFLFLLVPIFTYCQDSSSFKTERKKMYFERVYVIADSNISETLSAFVPTIKGIKNFYRTESNITARIEKLTIDYQKYGCKWANTAVMFNHPMSASVNIIWKEGKYKVTISDIVFSMPGYMGGVIDVELNNAPKKDGSLSKSKTVIRSLDCLERYLVEQFDVNYKKKDNVW